MAKFIVNKGLSNFVRTIEAEDFETVGEFVDFTDAHGETVYRIKAGQVNTIERTVG